MKSSDGAKVCDQVVPRPLGVAGRAASSRVNGILAVVKSREGRETADDMAAGYVDGVERYWRGADIELEATRPAAE